MESAVIHSHLFTQTRSDFSFSLEAVKFYLVDILGIIRGKVKDPDYAKLIVIAVQLKARAFPVLKHSLVT